MTNPKIILLEFNELSPILLRDFMADGLLPSFSRLYKNSKIFTTDASHDLPKLNPWVQWVSVHSGMNYQAHQISTLGEGDNLQSACVAKVLSDADIPVGVFGSMNTNYHGLAGYMVPDPWRKAAHAEPSDLATYYDFVSNQVKEYSKGESNSLFDAVKFLWFLISHGLRPSTVVKIAKQLIAEFRHSELSWRRASLLDHIQYDLFRHLNKSHQVGFATFFSNSVAHFQHYYWRHMAPDQFNVPAADDEHPSLASAIIYGYQNQDALLGRIMADYPGSTLILCTALSQEPWDSDKVTYRPKDFGSLLQFVAIGPDTVTVEPVMAEEFSCVFASDSEAAAAKEHFEDLQVNGDGLFKIEQKDNELFMGCAVICSGAESLTIVRSSDGATIQFSELFYQLHTTRSGKHSADGVLWIRTGQHEVVADKVSLTSIAPTILAEFGVRSPEGMNGVPLSIS
jgi:hypothetical protein